MLLVHKWMLVYNSFVLVPNSLLSLLFVQQQLLFFFFWGGGGLICKKIKLDKYE